MLDWQDSALPKLCANVWIVTERLNLFFAQQTVQRISIRFTTERHEPETHQHFCKTALSEFLQQHYEKCDITSVTDIQLPTTA